MPTTWIDAAIVMTGSAAGVVSLWLRLRARTAIHLAHIDATTARHLGPHPVSGSNFVHRQRYSCWTMHLPQHRPGSGI